MAAVLETVWRELFYLHWNFRQT